MEADGLGSHIAIQVVRRGADRVAAAAVLEPCKAVDAEVPEDDTADKSRPRWIITVFEFPDNDQCSNLDSVLLQTGPQAAFYAADNKADDTQASVGDQRKIVHLLERRGVAGRAVTTKAAFKAGEDLDRDLSRLVGESELLQYKRELEYQYGFGCVACLIKQLELVRDEESWGRYLLRLGNLKQYMRLDSSAVEAINLLPPDRDAATEYGSIYQILNRCKTKMGERLLGRWLRQPLTDLAKIQARQDMVELLMDDAQLRCTLQDSALRGTPDLDNLSLRLQRKRAGLMDIYKVYTFAQRLPHYTGALSECEGTALRDRFLRDFERLRDRLQMFIEFVECVIDMNGLPDLNINPQHDPGLGELRDEMDEAEAEIDKYFERSKDGWAADMGIELRLETDKTRGFYFRSTKQNDDKKIRGCTAVRCEVFSILKNGVHFTNSRMRELASKYVGLKEQYTSRQSGLVRTAMDTALTYLPLVEAAGRLVAELDVLVSLGHVAALSPGEYVRPKLLPLGSGVMRIRGGRHPCLEMQSDVKFMPNDYDMEIGQTGFNIVTGPNMGGKSTYIRALGCLVVMAQVGSFIPVEEAEMSLVDAVLARVGAGDAAQRGISTFMAEMLEASTILQTATQASLLIIDELGRGTSTFDGFGLAWSISEYIVSKLKCFCLFATHFHELTALEQKQPGVRNLHVAALATPGNITMLYALKAGPCLESFGIHCATMARFPDSVIEEARRKAAELEGLESKTAFGVSPQKAKKPRTVSPGAQALLDLCANNKEAQGVLQDLARRFADVPLDALTDAEATLRLQAIFTETKQKLTEVAS